MKFVCLQAFDVLNSVLFFWIYLKLKMFVFGISWKTWMRTGVKLVWIVLCIIVNYYLVCTSFAYRLAVATVNGMKVWSRLHCVLCCAFGKSDGCRCWGVRFSSTL